MLRAAPWIHTAGPLALADLRHRYAGSALGGLWAVVGPLVEVAIYALIFGLLLQPNSAAEGLSYPLYIASGLLPWAALRESLEGSASVLADNRWIRRSRVPVELLVARQALAGAARAAVGVALMLAVALAAGHSTSIATWLAPLSALALQTAGVFGMGLALAPAGTLYPDLRPALTSGLTLLTFASPILFPESLITGRLAALVEWNPFTHLLRLYRAPLGGPALGGFGLAMVLLTPLALLVLGKLAERRLWWAARDRL